MPNNPHKGGARDDRVIALLNKLGEQLVHSERERLALGVKLTTLEQQYKRQTEKFQQAEGLSQRVDEALSQQNRMNRKLEQVTQDKVRMIRKLERIEEAVVETREALQSKALVLLTEQSVADRSGQPQRSADPAQTVATLPTAKITRANRRRKWSGRPLSAQAAAVAALVLIAVFGGWAATRMPSSDQTTIDAIAAAAPSVVPPAVVAENAIPPPLPAVPQDSAATGAPTAAAASSPEAAAKTAAPSVAAAAPVAPEKTAEITPAATKNTSGATADDGDDDSALAAQMNAIEPSAGNPENLERAARAPAKTVVPAAFTPKETRKDAGQEADIETFVAQQRDATPLTDRVKPDPSLPPVVREIEKKALGGVPEAQHDLAAIYTSGHAGVPTDYKKAAFWFKEAAVGGVANARYNLGVLYQQGLGVDKNIDKAIDWYRAAAVMGHPEAEYNLGIAHIEGIGTTYDPQRAARYFQQAANGGVVEASYNLGLIHENGLLGSPDKNEALYWYKRAADHGSREGQIALAQLEKNMKLTPAAADRVISGLRAEAPAQPAEPVEHKTAAANDNPTAKPPSDRTADATAETQTAAAPDADAAPQPTVSTLTPPGPSQNSALIAQIQEQLIKRGLYPGPADGAGNPVTSDAIRAYQSANNLGVDGRASQALLVHMLSGDLQVPATSGAGATANNADGGKVGNLRPGDMAMPDQETAPSRD